MADIIDLLTPARARTSINPEDAVADAIMDNLALSSSRLRRKLEMLKASLMEADKSVQLAMVSATDEERPELEALAAEIEENWKKLTAGTHALYTADETHREVSQHLGKQRCKRYVNSYRLACGPINY